MKTKEPYIIGVTGRSGSGKTSFVRNIQNYFGVENVSIHSMDNYYVTGEEQLVDKKGFKNFDLPESFYKEKFCADLQTLKSGSTLIIPKYEFKIEGGSYQITIKSAPVIIVEGLFIYHYDGIMNSLDYKVMVQLSLETSYDRRLRRDRNERNYDEEITRYRYYNHVEPAYQTFIAPHAEKMDLLVDNSISLSEGEEKIKTVINRVLEK